jgi:hypothetical protein
MSGGTFRKRLETKYKHRESVGFCHSETKRSEGEESLLLTPPRFFAVALLRMTAPQNSCDCTEITLPNKPLVSKFLTDY